MSLVKRVGYGNSLGVDVTGGSTFVLVASVVDGFEGPDAKAKNAETSLLTDWYDTFAPTSVDPGSVTYKIAYDPADANTHTLALLLASGAVANWQLTYSGGTPPTETFLGHVEHMGRSMKKGDFLVCNISIKVSGNPGFKTS
jgi:hypothetical protein